MKGKTGKNLPSRHSRIFDDVIANYVKRAYLPQKVRGKISETLRNSDFNEKDAHFFFPAIEELSHSFTDERGEFFGQKAPSYFSQPKFRSAYLLYFVPLHATKFLALFERHPEAIQQMLDGTPADQPLRILDIGSGPGTASLALAMALEKSGRKIEFDWIDSNLAIMKDGIEIMKGAFPDIPVRYHVGEWKRLSPQFSKERFSFILFGNVLNESRPEEDFTPLERCLEAIDSAAGALLVEPASRKTAQLLSIIRDELIARIPDLKLWGPCLHLGRCPLLMGRDWCHFSIPGKTAGDWFLQFSKGLGSERQWLKFSYLWIAGARAQVRKFKPDERLVVSEAIPDQGKSKYLLCEPEQVATFRAKPDQRMHRGDIIQKPKSSP